MWRYDKRSGQFGDRPVFVDQNPRQFMQDGQLITVPNRFAGGASAGNNMPRPQSRAEVDQLPPGTEFMAPDGTVRRTPMGMTTSQGGATLGSAYGSNAITAADAERVRQSLGQNGQAAFQKWLRDNNITIGGR